MGTRGIVVGTTLGAVLLVSGAAGAADEGKKCPGIVVEAYSGLGTGVESVPNPATELPRGSAIRVPAGKLSERGIEARYLAVVGSLRSEAPELLPSPESVALALENALFLATNNGGYTRVAIGFLGRADFLKRMDVSKRQLAVAIATVLARSSVRVALVLSGNAESQFFRHVLSEQHVENVDVLLGSIHNRELHGAAAIVEAVATEVGD